MFKKILVTTCVIASLSTGSAFAAPATSPSQVKEGFGAKIEDDTERQARSAVITQIMAASGMDELMEQLPALVAMGMDQSPPPPVESDVLEKFRTTVLQSFDSTRTRPMLVRFFEQRYDNRRYTEIVAMLDTPLAKKMTALELQAQTPEAQQEMMQFANSMLSQPSPQRLALVERIDQVQRATESMVELQVMMASAVMKSMNQIVPVEQKLTDEQMTQMLEQMREQSLSPARQFMQLSMVYTYRSLPDNELEEYVQLQESTVGRYTNDLLRESVINLFDGISVELANHIGQMFKANNAL